MATSMSPVQDRAAARRQATLEEVLGHAERIVAEQGAGAVTVSEIARRMGMRAPSLYKYFPSLHAIYDALFTRQPPAHRVRRGRDPGLRAGSRPSARGRAARPPAGPPARSASRPLLFFRPIPGFEPSANSYTPSQALWQRARDELRTAAHKRQLAQAADSDEAMRILTIAVAGVCSQQLANQPGAGFEDGLFTSLTDEVLDMFVNHYSPPGRKARRWGRT